MYNAKVIIPEHYETMTLSLSALDNFKLSLKEPNANSVWHLCEMPVPVQALTSHSVAINEHFLVLCRGGSLIRAQLEHLSLTWLSNSMCVWYAMIGKGSIRCR